MIFKITIIEIRHSITKLSIILLDTECFYADFHLCWASQICTLCWVSFYLVFWRHLLNYCLLLSMVCTFLHWKRCWNIPCALYTEGSWERVLWWLYLRWLFLLKLLLKNKNYFFCQKSLWNSGANFTCMRIILDKIWWAKIKF